MATKGYHKIRSVNLSRRFVRNNRVLAAGLPAGPASAPRDSGVLARFAAIGAERPAVALGITDREVPGTVVGFVQALQHLRAGRRGPREHLVRLIGYDMAAEAARLDRPEVSPASGRTEPSMIPPPGGQESWA